MFWLASAIAAAACTEPRTESHSFAGKYAQKSFDGAAVPLVFETTPGTRWLYLVDTLYSDGQGSFVHTHLIAVDSLVDSYRRIQRTDETGHYTMHHDTVFFQCDDPHCDLPGRGIFQPNGDLTVVSILYGQAWSVYTPLR